MFDDIDDLDQRWHLQQLALMYSGNGKALASRQLWAWINNGQLTYDSFCRLMTELSKNYQ